MRIGTILTSAPFATPQPIENQFSIFLMEVNMGKISKLRDSFTVFSILATRVLKCMQKNTIFDPVRVSGRMGI